MNGDTQRTHVECIYQRKPKKNVVGLIISFDEFLLERFPRFLNGHGNESLGTKYFLFSLLRLRLQ